MASWRSLNHFLELNISHQFQCLETEGFSQGLQDSKPQGLPGVNLLTNLDQPYAVNSRIPSSKSVWCETPEWRNGNVATTASGKATPTRNSVDFDDFPYGYFLICGGSPNSPWVSIPVVMVIHDVHLVMTNSLPWNIHPFLRTVNHLFLWAIEIPWLC